MTLQYVSGDLLTTSAALIAHGVAPGDDFKSGLALSLRERFPTMYKDFRHWCKSQSPKPGAVWLWAGVGAEGRAVRIAALLTQDPPHHAGGHPGRAHMEHVNHALHELRKLILAENIQSVALPRLATGVGGLEWDAVRPLIEKTLGGLPAAVTVYETYVKPAAARAPVSR